MKIGIITFQRANNYGAMFQAYALSKYLEQQGHDIFILDYLLQNKFSILSSMGIVDKFLYLKENSQSVIRFPMTLGRRLLRKISDRREKKFIPHFVSFRKKYLNITSIYVVYTFG
jgi:hypothetical protein